MRRRSLLRTAPALALPALSGCAALYGRIETQYGESHLHPGTTQFVEGGLTTESDDDFRAWLYTDRPSADPILDIDDEVAARSLRRALLEESYDGAFTLLVEAKAPYDERFHLTPTHLVGPEWVRLADVELPLLQYPDGGTIGFASEFVVATALVRYEARTPPSGATVDIYPEAADADAGVTPLARFDARTVG